MASEALVRQARARAERTGEPFAAALEAVLETEAGRQREELRDGPWRDEGAKRWREDLPRKRAGERGRARQEAFGPPRVGSVSGMSATAGPPADRL